jgi:hypothetical protein
MKKDLKSRIAIIAFIFYSICTFSACTKKSSPSDFNSAPFKDSPSTVTLCFDLRNDAHPVAGLVLKLNQTSGVETHQVALPFESSSVATNSEIFSTWGSYGSTTLISYHTSPTASGNYALGIVPDFGPSPPDPWDEDPRELNESSVYFIRSNNFIRHFVFKYPDADPNKKQWLQNLSLIADKPVESIGVILPTKEIGKEIRRTGRTSIPDPIYDAGAVKFYPAKSIKVGDQDVGALYIKYELPPTKWQEIIIEQLIKLVVALLPPIVQFIVLRLRRPEQRRQAKRLIWVIAGVQVLLITGLIYMAVSAWNEPTLESTSKAFADLTTAILSGLFTGYNLWEDKKSTNAPQ